MTDSRLPRLGVLLVAVLLCLSLLRPVLVALDRDFWHETVRRWRNELLKKEDWAAVPPLPALDYRWLESRRGATRRIAHALGRYNTPLANELGAVPLALADGFDILEVDLWLDKDGEVRCFHGPGDPGPLTSRSCTFERLLAATRRSATWLVLDIKTDFALTSARIMQQLQYTTQDAPRVIFQLYHPQDVRRFAQLLNGHALPGPIITAYDSSASLNEVAEGVARSGVKVMTIPYERARALTRPLSGVSVFVHPVHDCATMAAAQAAGYRGVYTLSGLRC